MNNEPFKVVACHDASIETDILVASDKVTRFQRRYHDDPSHTGVNASHPLLAS